MKNKITYLFFALSIGTFAQNQVEKSKVIKNYNLKLLTEFEKKIRVQENKDRKAVKEYATKKNIPLRTVDSTGTVRELQRIYNGKPIYFETNNEAAAISTRTRSLNSGGSLGLNLEGQNMNIGVWDAGYAKLTHQEYDGIGGQNRVQSMDTAFENIAGQTMQVSHSAHVIGTIASSGANPLAKGMAPQAKVKSYIWNNALSETTTEAKNGLLISSHSYGDSAYDGAGNYLVDDYYAGAYIDLSRDWDNLMYNSPSYLMVTSVGNSGAQNTSSRPLLSGYDKILGYKTCKNALVVANGQDAVIDTNGNLISVEIHPTSSQGPTDDLRIKPDITGNGTQVFSTNHDGDTNYTTKTGSSMATPNVSGTALLLQQHFNNLNGRYMKASTLKGLILHTADDAGIAGPDAVYGWGLMNAKKAAEVITNKNKFSRIQELSISNGQTLEFQVESDGINNLVASISWTDPAATTLSTLVNDNTAKLINDLDIRISKDGINFFPWKLTSATTNELGDNNRDPYEKITIANASGLYTVRVSHKKASLQGRLQNFSLIISGLKELPSCVSNIPTNIKLHKINTTSVTLFWDSNVNNHYTVSYKKAIASTWTDINTTTNSINLTGLSSYTNYNLRIRNTCDFSEYSDFSQIFDFKTPLTNDNTAPTAPTNLSSANITTNTVQLNWSSSTDNIAVRNYEIYQNNILIGTSLNNSFTVSGLTANTNYTFSVKAVDTNNNYSTSSNTINATTLSNIVIDTTAPTAPTNLSSVNVTTNSVQLNWTPSIDNVAIKNYEIYQNGILIGTSLNNSFTVSGLTANTNYTFSVKAVDTNNNYSTSSNTINATTLSNIVIDTTAPTAPTNLSSVNVTTNSVQLNWTPSTDNVAIKNYEIYQNGILIGTSLNNSFTVSGLTANTNYTFSVKAVDTNNNYSTSSNTINATTLSNIVIDITAPTAPTNLSSANITTNSVQLNWTPSTDNVAIKNYEIYQNSILIGTTITTYFAVSGLTANTNYIFSVKAVDTNNNYSASSNTISIKTQENIIVVPNYCNSKANYSTSEWIDYVELNQIKNQTVSANGYSDHTAIETNLPIGNNTITLSTGMRYASSYTKFNFTVWIDYNKNGAFEVTEKAVNTSSYSNLNLTNQFTVPANASLGKTRMRIQMKTTSPTTSACDTFLYGEVEDYTVNITSTITNQSVESLESQLIPEIYPNPVSDYLNIRANSDYELFNSLGNLMKSEKNATKIEMSGYPAGIYILKSQNKTYKIIKN